MTITERPTLPTLAEVRESRVSVDLDRLPLDPDGWCSWDITEGGWSHTALCSHGVANGGPRLCEMWNEKDRRDAGRRRDSARELAAIAAAERMSPQPWNGGRDAEIEARRDGSWYGADVSDRVYGRGASW